jgi:hypothetical protein
MWSNISLHVPGVISQSQITIGMGVSRNTERAEAIVELELTVQLDLKMRSREAQSSTLALMDKTTLRAFSRRDDLCMSPHPFVCDRFSATFPPITGTSPASAGVNRNKCSKRGY